jgi:small-conductance mechanosensitive channel
LFVIAVIVMSNPYVGYGKQVFYVLSRVVATACLIPIFSWMHNRLKRSSSDFFFYYTDGSAVKERFPAGKAWYGAFIVVWFVIFVVLGIVLGARLWGVHIGLLDIRHWFSHTIYSPGLDEVTGKPILVTGMSLFRIVMYVLGGFAIAYVINRYVLQRIFDPLLIGSGVQSTILTITRYVVVVIAFLVGLHSAGLEGMAMKLVVLAGILSFAVKEPLADFFAYFVILVQRPVKIGDLIQVDPDIIGIVRHITPRSIILRNRNSVTLIIPNSMLITRMVRNWSYVRTFSAVNDIEITLPFNVDVDKAKQIMLDVVENHPAILKNPTPIVWLTEFAEHGYKFIIRGFISADKVTERFEIESQVRFELVRRLRQEGIHIAVPIRFIRTLNEGDSIVPQ